MMAMVIVRNILVAWVVAATAQAARAEQAEITDNLETREAVAMFGAGAVVAATTTISKAAPEAALPANRLSPTAILLLGLAAITVVRSKEWCSKKLKA